MQVALRYCCLGMTLQFKLASIHSMSCPGTLFSSLTVVCAALQNYNMNIVISKI